ncbi:host attachment protein [Nostoc sp. TCL26-01]|uniref:host attachment protein n=1 Tax=Nostoc sp. TCL26-01 TaxID=2576904 RepID=UPI0015BED897|nr:host attachment protein [Nostoc sp. TCL26-01]QLE55417.1 host attachment protein [Nostoc sp. TCL26-01]
MSIFLIAVIDGKKARFLTLEPSALPEYQSSPNLTEHEVLLNSAKELSGQELWASTKTGRNRGVAGQAHSYDDHRDNHMLEFERRFAHTVSNKIINLTQVKRVQQLLLIAESQILGLMRESLASVLPKNIHVNELAKNLCHLKPHELHEYLAHKQLLPASKRISG